MPGDKSTLEHLRHDIGDTGSRASTSREHTHSLSDGFAGKRRAGAIDTATSCLHAQDC